MLNVLRGFALALTVAILVGCVSTSELQLASNVWRLETEGRGTMGSEAAANSSLKSAAELTIREGFTHFILVDPSSSKSRQVVGRTPVYSTTNVSVYGNTATARTNYFGGQPVVASATNVGVTVILLREGDPGFGRAIDAASVIARFGG